MDDKRKKKAKKSVQVTIRSKSWRWYVLRRKETTTVERWNSYIFKIKYLKTYSECVWMFLGIIAKVFFFIIISFIFWKKGANKMSWVTKLQKSGGYKCGCNRFMWFKEKGQKYLAFLTALPFHEDYGEKEKKINVRIDCDVGERTRSTTELNCKPLWCAPLQRDAAWEITLHLTSKL